MSLLVWLPMTKDLTQQGISDITVTNNGATLSADGKLGKCYYFDGNAHYVEFSKSVGDLYSGDFSYTVWLKPTDDTRSIICSEYAATGASGIAFELTASRQIRLYWNGSPDIYATGCVLPKNVWTHCAITRSGNVAKFYMNGILTYTYTGTLANKTSTAKIRLGDDYRGGTSVTYMGYMNDFRLYNHCLSAKEVEIISRGLVAHYSLKNNTGGQPNLFDFESIASKWVASGTTMTNYTDSIYGNVLKVSTGSSISGETRIYRNLSNVWTASQVYTVSFMAKASKTTTVKVSRSLADYASDFTVGTEWKRYSGTINCTATVSGGTLSIQNYTASSDLYITQVKLELGNKVTAYQPGVGDPKYNPLGFNTTTEYDMSGNGYHGTKQGTISYESDTSKYSVCSYFADGLTDMIKAPIELGTDAITMNIWIRSKNGTAGTGGYHMPLEIDGAYYEMSIGSDGKFRQGFYVNGARKVDTTPSVNIISDKKWHMITATFDGTNIKRYVDGALVQTQAASGTLTGGSRTVYIGGTYGGNSGYATKELYESDARIYATALTADQVLDLYKSSASVTNNGTLLGYEFVEV